MLEISPPHMERRAIDRPSAGDTSVFGRLLGSAPGDERLCWFREWLQLTLELQLADLEEHICSLSEHQRIHFESWLAAGLYNELIPEAAAAPERILFLTDLETVLSLRPTT